MSLQIRLSAFITAIGADIKALRNDIRWTDSRAPNGTAGGSLTGSYPNPTLAAGGTAKQVLASNGVSAPTWQTLDLTYLPDSAFKKSCKAATTVNVALSGLQTIDTIALIANDRCLVKNQTLPQANGIYAVQSGAWARVAGADTSSEISAGVVAIDSGVQGGTHWINTFKATDTIGITPMPWYFMLDSSNVDDGLAMMGGF